MLRVGLLRLWFRCERLPVDAGTAERFVSPASSTKLESICQMVVLKNTQKCMNWVIRVCLSLRSGECRGTKHQVTVANNAILQTLWNDL